MVNRVETENNCICIIARIKYWFALLLVLASCNNIEPEATSTKIAKVVPRNYKNVANGNFSHHQDTIYFGQQHFAGYLYSLYSSGDTEYVKSYFGGLEEGAQKKWYSNGQLAEQRFYVNGKKEGLQQSWWPDGKQKFLYTAASDTYVGELKEWNRDGMLYRDFHYTKGQEDGSEKMWWANGTIRANYVIRDGKRYGLLGMKVCENPYDSISKK